MFLIPIHHSIMSLALVKHLVNLQLAVVSRMDAKLSPKQFPEKVRATALVAGGQSPVPSQLYKVHVLSQARPLKILVA